MNEFLVSLPLVANDDSQSIGNKARSLDWLIKHDFRVPETFVLTTDFFECWIDIVEDSTEWTTLLDNLTGAPTRDRPVFRTQCRQLRKLATSLQFTSTQLLSLAELQDRTESYLAIRSSGMDEDLPGASFAGMYESYLNVSVADIA